MNRIALGGLCRLPQSALAVIATASLMNPTLWGSAAVQTSCGQSVLSRTALAKYQRVYNFIHRNRMHPRLELAVRATLLEWEAAGRLPPEVAASPKTDLPISSPTDDVFFPIRSEPWLDFSVGPNSKVQAWRVDGQNAFFLNVGYQYNWSAFGLSRAMGLNRTPLMRPAVVSGWFGVLSDEVVGTPFEEFMGFGFDMELLAAMVARGEIDANSLSDVEGFHFLVGDTDGNSTNFSITPEREVIGYDFDNAFTLGFSWMSGTGCFLGHVPPLRYSERFIAGLNALTDRQLDIAAASLPAPTRRKVAFRRDVMKMDIRLRGASAHMYPGIFPLDRVRD